MFKFADDLDLITILEQYETILDDLDNIEVWAKAFYQVINKSKTKELIFRTGKIQTFANNHKWNRQSG